ncbi:hypothetical protein MPSEU_000815200 [Mayamaea pseudoterrestris]|nr:hypothetical protein MPSEU_000815200 [Mayamaea pseudoterrestris]
MSRKERSNRSVLDYDNEDDLRKALMSMELNEHGSSDMATDELPAAPERIEAEEVSFDTTLDWVLPVYDPETTETQSMKQEIRRLQVLKSYEILESDREEAFDRITSMATRVFKTPVAIITLVDLGRQWFLSTQNFDVVESPRATGFCSHAVLSKSGMMIVLDATKDFRFHDNALVTGDSHLRFYAGASLLAPEGYKLGALCLVDFEPRTCFTEDDQATLMDMARMVVDVLVSRRKEKQREGNPAQFIAYTAHDLMTPLSGVQLSLSLLAGDNEMKEKLSYQQAELLSTASTCSELMIRICKSASDALQGGGGSELGLDPDLLHDESSDILAVTKIDELIKSLRMLTGPIHKQVPVVIRIDPAVPPLILCDDLKLFRSALNLLSSAVYRTQKGGVQLRIAPSRTRAALVFEIEDTADDVPVETYQYLFKPSKREDGSLRMCLSSVASLISSLDGECGFRPRVDKSVRLPGPKSRHETGSIFWFSVPLFAPDSLGANGIQLPIKNVGMSPWLSTCSDPSLSRTLTKKTFDYPSYSHGSAPMRGYDANPLNTIVRSHTPSSMLGWSPTSEIGQGSIALASNGGQDMFGPPLSSIDAYETIKHGGDLALNSHDALPLPSGPRTRKALVIDDSLVIRKSIGIALSKVGYDVVQAVNGWEGLTRMKETIFDFVLCDLLMPIMDGFDSVKQYREWERANRPSPKQIIIGISAHTNPDAASQSFKAGMDDFRAKPITIKNLTEICESAEVVSHAKVLDVASELEMHVEGSSGSSGNPTDDSDDTASRKRDTDDELSTSSVINDESEFGKKRQRIGSLSHKGAQRVCLVAMDRPTATAVEAFRELEQVHWKVVTVHDGDDAFRLLQMRIWDLVLIDDDLEGLGGTQSIVQFRQWEHEHRLGRQRNLVLVSDVDIPSPFDKYAFVQAPSGFNSVIGKPIAWGDIKYLLKASRPADAVSANVAVAPAVG